MHRLVVSEQTMHQAKCNVCKQYPMVGFRYRSLRRFNFDVCQHCFLFAKQNNRFKIDDPLHEYYIETTSADNFKDFVRVILNKLKKTGPMNGSHFQCAGSIATTAICGARIGTDGIRRLGYLPLPRNFDHDGRNSTLVLMGMDAALVNDEIPIAGNDARIKARAYGD
ncbi:hypothetical protein ACOME3_009878 [Neoechinorhynchus agilis]